MDGVIVKRGNKIIIEAVIGKRDTLRDLEGNTIPCVMIYPVAIYLRAHGCRRAQLGTKTIDGIVVDFIVDYFGGKGRIIGSDKNPRFATVQLVVGKL